MAEHLGVSQAWVARALGDDARISEQSRRRVREAASELGYDPEAHRAARSLIASRYGRQISSGVIACLNLSLVVGADPEPNEYGALLLHGVQQAALLQQQEILLADPSAGLRHGKVDGILGFGIRAWKMRKEWYPDLPFVMAIEPIPDGHYVAPDDYGGMRQAMDHLLALGHRRIGYLMYPPSEARAVSRRSEAYRDALREAEIVPDPRWVRTIATDPPVFRDLGRAAMSQWLREDWSGLGITALLAHNDQAAFGAMVALKDAGLRVPEDVSLIGFDGTRDGEHCSPRLTSIRSPLSEMGRTAAELLLRVMRGEVRDPQQIVLPTTLIERESTARCTT